LPVKLCQWRDELIIVLLLGGWWFLVVGGCFFLLLLLLLFFFFFFFFLLLLLLLLLLLFVVCCLLVAGCIFCFFCFLFFVGCCLLFVGCSCSNATVDDPAKSAFTVSSIFQENDAGKSTVGSKSCNFLHPKLLPKKNFPTRTLDSPHEAVKLSHNS